MKVQTTIRSGSKPRDGWDEAFKSMADAGDDKPLIEDEGLDHSWDQGEWEW